MKPCYLIDPWLLEIKPEDSTDIRFKRLTSLKKLKELHEKYGMIPVKFVDDEFKNSLLCNHRNFQRAEWDEVGKLLSNTMLREAPQGQDVEIIGLPSPIPPAHWLSELGEIGCDRLPPNWRKPIIVFPEDRTATWPNSADKNRELKYKIRGSTEVEARNLVCIESYDQHTYFEPDLDPWRIGAVGAPAQIAHGAVGERRESMRRLPRPLLLLPLNLTFTQIVQELQNRIDWSCGHEGKAYFIPHQDWDPRTISQEEWRSGNIFRTDTVRGGQRGKLDREYRIWLWDPIENHWDVQLPRGGYITVSHDGSTLKERP